MSDIKYEQRGALVKAIIGVIVLIVIFSICMYFIYPRHNYCYAWTREDYLRNLEAREGNDSYY